MTYLKKGSDLTLFFSMTQSNLAAATIGPATLSKVFSLAPSICLQIVTPQRTSYFENNNVAHSQQSKYDNCNGSFSPRGNITYEKPV